MTNEERQRQKFLLNDLGAIRSYLPDRKPPKEIDAARRLINRYEQRRRIEASRYRRKIEMQKDAIRHLIYFGSHVKASNMIQALKRRIDSEE